MPQSCHTEDRRDAVVIQRVIVLLGGLSHRTCRGQLPLVEVSLGHAQPRPQLELSMCRVISDFDGLFEHLGSLSPRTLVKIHNAYVGLGSRLDEPIADLPRDGERVVEALHRLGGLAEMYVGDSQITQYISFVDPLPSSRSITRACL